MDIPATLRDFTVLYTANGQDEPKQISMMASKIVDVIFMETLFLFMV